MDMDHERMQIDLKIDPVIVLQGRRSVRRIQLEDSVEGA